MKLSNSLLFLIIFFLFSCEKDVRNFKLRGMIRNEKTLTGVSEASVQLYEYSGCGWDCDDYKDLIDATETDEEGNYGFKFQPLIKRKSYGLTVKHPQYFTAYKIMDENELEFWKKNKMDYNANPVATLIINVKNASPVYLNDKLELHVPGGCANNDPHSNVYSGLWTFHGMNVNTSIKTIVIGNQYSTILKHIWKIGGITDDTTIVYCPQFETTVYNLNY